METNNASGAYSAKAMEIIGMVNALQQYADGLHDVNPDDVNWGHVGDLERVASMLREVLKVAK